MTEKCGESLDKAKKNGKAVYYATYRLPGGKQRRERVGKSYAEAVAADGKRQGQKAEGKILDSTKEKNLTFSKLAEEWFSEQPTKKRLKYFNVLMINIRSFCKIYGDHNIYGISVLDLKNYQVLRKDAGMSDSYVDQEIAAVRNMLNTAWEGEKISGDALAPFKRVKKLLKKNANARDIVIEYSDFQKLMDALPLYARNIVATAFYTGMRRGEVMALTWDRVDLKKREITLEAEHTKTNEKRIIPISDKLLEILKSITKMIKMDPLIDKTIIEPHVFLYRGGPITDIRGSLKSACNKIGIPYGRNTKGGVTFHDLRHTFNTNMRRSGNHDTVIMDITGHSTREMFDRYNTVGKAEKREAIRNMERSFVDQSVDQKDKGGK